MCVNSSAAYSQYPRCVNTSMAREPPYLGTRDPCNQVPADEFTHMGHSIRTAEWRYTEWPRWTGAAPDWTRIDGIELYDHRDDDGGRFDSHELVNVAGDPQHAALVKRLRALLRAGPLATSARVS